MAKKINNYLLITIIKPTYTFIRYYRIVRLRGSSCCVGESGTKVVAREEDLCEVWSSEKDRQEKAA